MNFANLITKRIAYYRSSKVNENIPNNPNKDDDGQHFINYNIFFLQILETFKITISLNVFY